PNDSSQPQMLSHYAFDINGPALTAQLQGKAPRQAGAQPLFTSLSPIASLTGHGELWLDANGLPIRQTVDIKLPKAMDKYDVHLNMIANFSDFGKQAQTPTVQGGSAGGS